MSDSQWPRLDGVYTRLTKGDQLLGVWALLRSAMFSTQKFDGAGKRPTLSSSAPLELHAVTPYLGISQVKGERLSQRDADVFFWLLARAYQRGRPRGAAAVVTFTKNEASTALLADRGGKQRQLVDDSLDRLFDAEFEFKVNSEALRMTDRVRLISVLRRVEGGTEKEYDYKVSIPLEVAKLLEGGKAFTLFGAERAKLKDPLARGLYSYYQSLALNLPDKVTTAWLKKLMGRDREGARKGTQESKWLEMLDRALSDVQEVTGWPTCQRVLENGKWKVSVVKGAPNKHDIRLGRRGKATRAVEDAAQAVAAPARPRRKSAPLGAE